jgi:hypothetical protein
MKRRQFTPIIDLEAAGVSSPPPEHFFLVQVPADLPAIVALASIFLCVMRRVVIVPQPGWEELLNLHTMTVLTSGNRKSDPFEAWKEEQKAPVGEAIAVAQTRQWVLESALHRVEAAALHLVACSGEPQPWTIPVPVAPVATDLAIADYTLSMPRRPAPKWVRTPPQPPHRLSESGQ